MYGQSEHRNTGRNNSGGRDESQWENKIRDSPGLCLCKRVAHKTATLPLTGFESWKKKEERAKVWTQGAPTAPTTETFSPNGVGAIERFLDLAKHSPQRKNYLWQDLIELLDPPDRNLLFYLVPDITHLTLGQLELLREWNEVCTHKETEMEGLVESELEWEQGLGGD
jgi:hypothetical protein